MAIPELVDPEAGLTQRCATADRWRIRLELVDRLTAMAALLEFDVQIISGARSRAHQDRLEQEGRPAAPWDLSTHADEYPDGCPRTATGADVMPLVAVTNAVKARLGAEATRVGLRWGGGGPVDPETGIPEDWQHVDLGPRSETDPPR